MRTKIASWGLRTGPQFAWLREKPSSRKAQNFTTSLGIRKLEHIFAPKGQMRHQKPKCICHLEEKETHIPIPRYFQMCPKTNQNKKLTEVIPRDPQTAVISPWERLVVRSWKSVRLHPIVTKLHLVCEQSFILEYTRGVCKVIGYSR